MGKTQREGRSRGRDEEFKEQRGGKESKKLTRESALKKLGDLRRKIEAVNFKDEKITAELVALEQEISTLAEPAEFEKQRKGIEVRLKQLERRIEDILINIGAEEAALRARGQGADSLEKLAGAVAESISQGEGSDLGVSTGS